MMSLPQTSQHHLCCVIYSYWSSAFNFHKFPSGRKLRSSFYSHGTDDSIHPWSFPRSSCDCVTVKPKVTLNIGYFTENYTGPKLFCRVWKIYSTMIPGLVILALWSQAHFCILPLRPLRKGTVPGKFFRFRSGKLCTWNITLTHLMSDFV